MNKKELRRFLSEHPRDQFADWLLDVARESPDFKQRLQFYIATHHSWEEAAKAVMEAIERFSALQSNRRAVKPAELLKQGRFLLESLRACLDFHPDEGLANMVEIVMKVLDEMTSRVAPEDPRMAELQAAFGTLYLRLMQLHPPDPKVLAEKLFDLRSNSRVAILPDAPKAYLELLGSVGLERFRQLLEPTVRIVVDGHPEPKPRTPEGTKFYNRKIMVFEWATISSDVDEQVMILLAMSRNPDDVLIVLRYLESQQRPMDALDIAAKAHRKTPSPKLAFYLAERFELQNQPAEALPYRWYLLQEDPSRQAFEDLMHSASKASQTQEWRERAMSFLSENAKGVHIELLLAEGRHAEALSQARQFGARLSIWTRLAESFIHKEPRLAIELFFDCAEFSLKERIPDNHILSAWQLTVDNETFQIFRSRIHTFFANHKIPDSYVAKLVDSGVPVARLLATLDTGTRKD